MNAQVILTEHFNYHYLYTTMLNKLYCTASVRLCDEKFDRAQIAFISALS